MKKLFLSVIAIILFAACSQDAETNLQPNGEKMKITGEVSAFQYDGETRTTLDYKDDVLKFKWSLDDTVAVFGPSGQQQLDLKIDNVVTTDVTCANFSITHDFTLAEGKKYIAYTPRVNNIELNAKSINYSLEGQVQDGSSLTSTAHLGKYDYMVSLPVVPENNEAKFEFKHHCVPVLFTITDSGNKYSNYETITFKTDGGEKVFHTKGTFKIDTVKIDEKDSVKLTPNEVADASEVSLNFKEPVNPDEQGKIYAWIMLNPVDLQGHAMQVVLTLADGTMIFVPKTIGRSYVAGKYYKVGVDVSLADKIGTSDDIESGGKD